MLRESLSPEDDLLRLERERLLTRAVRSLFARRREKLSNTQRAVRERLEGLLAEGRDDLSYAEIGGDIGRDPSAVHRATSTLLVLLLRRLGVFALLKERQRRTCGPQGVPLGPEESARARGSAAPARPQRRSRSRPLIEGATVDDVIDALIEIEARRARA